MTTWSDGPVLTSHYEGPERRQASREPIFTQILTILFPNSEPAREQIPAPCVREAEAG